jgi:Fic family protein
MLFRSATITPAEEEVIEKIENARQKLRHNLAKPRRWGGLLRRNTFARAIQGSNSIEGYNVTREDAIAAAEGEEPLDADREAWMAVTGYRNAMTFVLQLAKDKSFSYNEGIIRSLHFMMVQHDLSKRPGNWRLGTIYVREEPSGNVVYEGPEVEMVPGLIEELIEFLNDDLDKSHALIKGAMAHLNLVMVHPFADGNGRMARCLQTLVLAQEGILESEFCSIEEYLGKNTQDYYRVLAQTGEGSWRPRNSTKAWIQFNLTAHYRQAVTLVQRSKVMDSLWQEMQQIIDQHGLPERLLYALCDAAIGYRVRNASYRHMAELNDIMASRDLRNAVAAGLLIPNGERRGRIYIGAPHIKAICDKLRREHLRRVADPFAPGFEQLELLTLS